MSQFDDYDDYDPYEYHQNRDVPAIGYGTLWVVLFIALVLSVLIVTVLASITPASAHDRGEDQIIKVNPDGVYSAVVDYRRGTFPAENDHFCTGFYIGNGKFVSAGHCLAEADKDWRVIAENPNGGIQTYTPDFQFVSSPFLFASQDFSVTFVDPDRTKDLTPLVLDCSYEPKIGDPIVVEGFPENLGRLVVTGSVAAAKSSPWVLWKKPLIRAQVPIAPGNSGSPVRLGGLDGPVIGIAVGALPDNRSLIGIQPLGPLCNALGLDKGAEKK